MDKSKIFKCSQHATIACGVRPMHVLKYTKFSKDFFKSDDLTISFQIFKCTCIYRYMKSLMVMYIAFHYNFLRFQNITDAMKTVCEILTADPEGGPSRIPFPLFKDLYTYLAQIDGEISQQQINEVCSYLKYHV